MTKTSDKSELEIIHNALSIQEANYFLKEFDDHGIACFVENQPAQSLNPYLIEKGTINIMVYKSEYERAHLVYSKITGYEESLSIESIESSANPVLGREISGKGSTKWLWILIIIFFLILVYYKVMGFE